MKKLFCLLAVIFIFTLFASGCSTAQDVTDGINKVNDSVQDVNKAVQNINKSIEDTGNKLLPDSENNGSGESGVGENEKGDGGESEEE